MNTKFNEEFDAILSIKKLEGIMEHLKNIESQLVANIAAYTGNDPQVIADANERLAALREGIAEGEPMIEETRKKIQAFITVG